MIHFGIIHATHRKDPTIPRTLATMHVARIREVTVFTDWGELGATWNLIKAIRYLAQLQSNAHLCVVDDDLIFCSHAKRILMEGIGSHNPGTAFSMWTIEQNIPHSIRERNGWVHAAVGLHTWGGSVAIPSTIGSELALRMQAILEADINMKTKPDAVLYSALDALKVPVMHHLPSLCSHVGLDSSTLGNDHGDGQTRGFRFDQWNR